MTAPAAVKPCLPTGCMAGVMAVDAATVVDLLTELIGAGSQDSNTLACMRLMVARIGMVADALARAHGGETWAASPEDWLWPVESEAAAWNSVNGQPMAVAMQATGAARHSEQRSGRHGRRHGGMNPDP